MEDIIMKELRVKACNEFIIGKYYSSKDILRRKDITDGQLINAVGKRKWFCIYDWFGNRTHARFTIKKIEKTEFGDYIYTISSNKDVPERYFPSLYQIVDLYLNTAVPVSYSILHS